jgi:hypothetical protein
MSKRPVRKVRPVSVQHVLKIESWRFIYSFGTGKTKFCPELYSDHRHLELKVSIVEPKGIKANRGLVRCFAYDGLIEGYKQPAASSAQTKAVGEVYYRGADYQAILTLPTDALPLILQMLAAGKYRLIEFDADKDSREISNFSFLDYFGSEPDLAADWDDA